uniref:AP-4 complex subunit sigma-1-like n=1 Tax=Myxine glutinosa TaxID=7769 RepID=UPI00358ED54D
MMKFWFVVNRQGQTRLTRYFEFVEENKRAALEKDVVTVCLAQPPRQCSFVEYKDFRLIFRCYASVVCIVGIDEDENELAIYELIQNFVETLDKYFNRVCELDILFHLDKVHVILEETVMGGQVLETNNARILSLLHQMDQTSREK